MSTTHVAGPCISFQSLDRVIQRCAVCGYKLLDMLPSRTMVCTQDESRAIPAFTVAHMIEVEEGNPKRTTDVGNFFTRKLPDNFCLKLVEVGND